MIRRVDWLIQFTNSGVIVGSSNPGSTVGSASGASDGKSLRIRNLLFSDNM
jgi:hypothetical protein